MSSLLDQDDELRADLEAEYSPPDKWQQYFAALRQPQVGLGGAGTQAPWVPEANVPMSPLSPSTVAQSPETLDPAEPPSDDRGEAVNLAVSEKPQGDPRKLDLDRVSAALYSATTRKPLSEDYFAAPRQEALKREAMQSSERAAMLKRALQQKKEAEDNQWVVKAIEALRPEDAAKIPPEVRSKLTRQDLSVVLAAADRKTGQNATQERFEDSSKRGWTALGLQEQGQARTDARAGFEQMEAMGNKTEVLAAIGGALKNIQKISPALMYGQFDEKQFPRSTIEDVLSRWTPGGWALGRRFADPKANEFAMALGQLEEMIERMRTGAVINDDEHKRIQATYSSAISAGPEAMAKMFPMIRAELATRLRAKQTAFALHYPEEFRKFHKVSNGATFLNPLFDDGGPTDDLPTVSNRPQFNLVARNSPWAVQDEPAPIDTTVQTSEPTPEQLTGLKNGPPAEIRVPPAAKAPEPVRFVVSRDGKDRRPVFARPDGSQYVIGDDGKEYPAPPARAP